MKHLLTSNAGQRHWGLTCLLAVTVSALAGCSNSDEIRRYTVERPVPEDRMLAAIIPRDERAWFFKLTGPNETLDELTETFFEFIGSIRFAEDEPQWELPEGWATRPGSRMRFATIEIDAEDEPLELSVTVLPKMAEDERLLLDNINRWRGQLQLSPLTPDQLADESVRIELEAEPGLAATLVNMVGNLSGGGGMAGAPFAGGNFAGGPPAGRDAPPPSRKKIEFEAPEGWQAGERVSTRGGIRIERDAVFEVVDGDERVEITVTQMPASGNTAGNISRWKAQVQLDAQAGTDEPKQVQVGGAEGVSVELVGPRNAILGVIASDQGTDWFIKLFGSRELALREKQRFEQFVESIQFQDP